MNELRHPGPEDHDSEPTVREDDVAIVGMAGRFPGARDLDELWRNLEAGVESIRALSDEELLAAGVTRERLDDPHYVKAGTLLEDVDRFDARFFDLSPREATIVDPQQRIFLECSWQALEDAGYDSRQARDRIGVYAAVGANAYLFNIYSQPAVAEAAGRFNIVVGNENDYLASRVSFKLDLKGPSVNVQSACSSSLLAVHLACESLHSGESDLVLAGGVFAPSDRATGYRFREGDIKSADGHCRPYDAGATGTIFSGGVGVVALKRLADALEDGDSVRAVIRGSAVNNDGSAKVGYTAPGVQGQRAVVSEALAVAGVDAGTVSYVEGHGTGTSLGDPIEVTALTQAFRAHTDRRGFCTLGSIKGNIGHADCAAGVAGLIKTVLALQHAKLPPTLNFERPNPRIDFDSSPFVVHARLREWETDGTPRRAGVSSFGIGGTNVHAVLEEAPRAEPSGPSRGWHLLPLSARTATALDAAAANLLARLESDPSIDLADAAFTLTVGRRPFEHRRALLCRDRDEAMSLLRTPDPKRVRSGSVEDRPTRVAFLFSGQGSQYAGMAAELYRDEPGFRAPLDRCADLLEPRLGLDLRRLLVPEPGEEEAANERLGETAYTQPALFAVEYALAQLWMEWGIEPEAMMGHSVGEYVAACLAGVFDLESALALVAARGRLMQELPAGSMLGVSLPAAELEELLPDGVALAATNGPKRSVASGPREAVAALEERLWDRGVACRPLHTSHAFHSPMMEPMLEAFRRELARVELRAPRVPYVSNVTGTWIRDEEATDPEHWLRHVRGTVRFSEGIATLAEEPGRVFLEVGPGTTLTNLVRQHPARQPAQAVIASTRHPKEQRSDVEALLDAAGELWVSGVALDGAGVYRHQRRRRVPLPTYPFERERYWVEPGEAGLAAAARAPSRRELPDWFYLPSWRPSVPPALPADLADEPKRWLLLADEEGFSGRLAGRLAERLAELGQDVVSVKAGDAFAHAGDGPYTVAPGRREDFESVLEELAEADRLPDVVLHLWSLDPVPHPAPHPVPSSPVPDPDPDGDAAVEAVQERGFYSLLALSQALGRSAPGRPVRLVVASSGVQRLGGESALAPEKATVLGPCRVIPREYPHVTCTSVDVDVPEPGGPAEEELVANLMAEACTAPGTGGPQALPESTIAYRGGERRVAAYEPVRLEAPAPGRLPLREEGVYLITGGLGGLGLQIAGYLAREHAARLVLVGRSGLPPRDEWDRWLEDHGEQHGTGGDEATGAKIRAVRDLEEAGGRVLVAAADVADAGAVRAVVEQARAELGALHGVFHAAGIAGGGMIQLKERAAAAAVLRPKLAGTRAVAAAVDTEPLDLFVLCSSTFAVLGGVGQVDYAAGNAFLDAFAHERRLRGVPCTAIDWAAWKEVGMAVDAGRARPDRKAPVPAGAPAPPALAAPSPVAQPPSRQAPAGAQSSPESLLGECLERSPQRAVYLTRMTSESHWVLAEHRVAGSPTVPGTTYLELVRAAFAATAGPGPVRILDLAFALPFSVPEGEAGECRLTLTRRGGAGEAYGFVVEGRPAGASDDGGWQSHATGRIESIPEARAERHDLARLEDACPKSVEVDPDALSRKGGLVEWGPRWTSLRSMRVGEDQVVAEIELPAPFHADLEGVVLHPALLDVATAAATFALAREPFLPLSYQRVDVLRSLPARFFSHARRRAGGDSGETLSFDVTLLDGEGEECVRIEGFTLKRVGAAAERLARTARPAGPEDLSGAAKASGPGLYARDGMTNAEGIEALRRVLSAPRLAQVAVSPRDLVALLQRAAAQGAEASTPRADSSRARHARPDTGRDFVEPESEVERTLAAVWSEVLGIEKVGLDDDFFRLGGDSVLGIQVVARTGEAGLRIRPEQLFEHATLRELAAAVSGESAKGSERRIPLTPFQRRVLTGAAAPWIAAAVPLADAEVEALGRALAAAVDRHQALRLRFPEGTATEAAALADSGADPGVDSGADPEQRPLAVRRMRWEGADEMTRGRSLREAAETLGRTLDPVRGPVIAAAWAEHSTAGGALLLVGHRAVADGVSMGTLCREILEDAAAGSAAAALDLGSVAELDSEETALLHGAAAEALRAEPREILLAGIARGVLPRIDAGVVAVEVEWDARSTEEPGAEGVVGCFLRSSLVRLEAPDAAESPVETVRRVKLAMRQHPEDAEPADGIANVEHRLRVAVLGDTGGASVWTGGAAPQQAPAVLAVQASVNEERFRVALHGDERGPEPGLAEEVVAALREISDQARTGGTETWSPVDFPDAELTQETLDAVLSKLDQS